MIAFQAAIGQFSSTCVKGAIWIIEEEGRTATGDMLLQILPQVCFRLTLAEALALLQKKSHRPALIFLERFPGHKTTREILRIKELFPEGAIFLISGWQNPEETSRLFSRALIEMMRPHPAPLDAQNSYGLSKREFEILKCMVNGLIKKEIAEQLSISYHTVDNHQRNIFRKLNVHTRSAAVAKALLEKLC